jgi:hypothetical protein
MCWMIFFATSRSFIPEAWNEQSNPQSVQQKTCISIASYELQHYPLILLNKCKAMTQCRPAANRLNYLSSQRQRVKWIGTGIIKDTLHSLSYNSDAGLTSQSKINILKNAIPWVTIMTLPLKNKTKRKTRRSLPASYL